MRYLHNSPTQTIFLLLIMVMGLTACVTVKEPGRPKVDKKEVLEANVNLGMGYLSEGQRDVALRAFTKALEIDSRSPKANQGMALIHQINGEFEMAEQRFRKALKSRSDESKSDIEYSFGRFLMERERYDEALEYFERASKDLTFSGRVNALFNLGLCAEKMGKKDRAQASYEHALNINSSFAPAAIELAHKMFEEGNYAEAKKYLDVFARNSRQSPRSLLLGIRIERIFGNEDKEASYALALKNLHPYSTEYLEYKKMLEAER